jgi:hypothetical protein
MEEETRQREPGPAAGGPSLPGELSDSQLGEALRAHEGGALAFANDAIAALRALQRSLQGKGLTQVGKALNWAEEQFRREWPKAVGELAKARLALRFKREIETQPLVHWERIGAEC